MRGHFQQRVGQFGFALGGDGAAGAGKRQRQAGQHGELRGKGFCAGHADFRPGHGLQHRIAFARHAAFRHVQHRKDRLPGRFHAAQRGECIGRFAALAHQQAKPAGR